ncbi:rhodanese-like domain-containing protein [Notoacmeibacter sp. MSK16QG-6]|uniref:rhodanese-like domain-containing protein n=1 Tax=Notoacmeibacter sp. MSK16QG-6 TaxID=2957982 RepID=UPI00209DE8D5|nr:rhodanese-like domain-containing protein [Notoacmeibacter sp. MSK16QG-6]MCP1198734.1 rhodanese-like domain-containing protein [Notoacmeibacter sp. MSK16QG-6]
MREEKLDNGVFEHWTVDELADALVSKSVAVIDVRTPQEYLFEHIQGALNAPMAFVDGADLPSQEGKRIVLHCGSGLRSERVAKQYLQSVGGRIAHLEGGFAKWKEAKKPYIGTDMGTGNPKKVDPSA